MNNLEKLHAETVKLSSNEQRTKFYNMLIGCLSVYISSDTWQKAVDFVKEQFDETKKLSS